MIFCYNEKNWKKIERKNRPFSIEFNFCWICTIFRIKPSHLLVSFEEQHVVTYERSARYTFADFLAICGGLLGLFLGISALSVIEFIYYSTLRLYWKLHYMKNKKRCRRITPVESDMKFKKLEINTIEPIKQNMF